MRRITWRRVGLTVMMATLLAGSGCEKTTTGIAIEIDPPSPTIEPGGAVTFTASIPEAESGSRQLYFPLEWGVSDSRLGRITNAAGNVAVYVASASNGVNTVTVRDQKGAEGVASVTQSVSGDDEI